MKSKEADKLTLWHTRVNNEWELTVNSGSEWPHFSQGKLKLVLVSPDRQSTCSLISPPDSLSPLYLMLIAYLPACK